MKLSFRSLAALMLCLGIFLSLPMPAARGEESAEIPVAENISSLSTVTATTGFPSLATLFDGKEAWGISARGTESEIALAHERGIGSLYFIYDCIPAAYTVTNGDTGEVYLEGERMSPANENVMIGSIRELNGRQKLYLITWEINGVQYGNHYITGFPTYDAQTMLGWVEKIAALPEPFTWEL